MKNFEPNKKINLENQDVVWTYPFQSFKMKKLNIALVSILNNNKKVAMNKDLNGGFGTCDDYGNSFSSKIIKYIKKSSVRLPIISFAFLQSILKENHNVEYFEEKLPTKPFDIFLLYGTIVDYKNENNISKLLKEKFPESKVGFFGPFPSTNPNLFNSDFTLIGEPESFFMNEFKDIKQLKGEVKIRSLTDMDSLPTPDFDSFPIEEYSYTPAIPQKPFLVLQASLGCPYSCSFYCVYGNYQGPKIRQRSAKKVVDDIVNLQEKYKIKGIQFRDPVFGLKKGFIKEFCNELKERNVNILWGMETRLDLLNEENVKQMFDVGLRNINAGIETNNPDIAKISKRKLVEGQHQESIIKFCEKMGVNISAFYILALEGDTEQTVNNTINYAIKLNTILARFAVATPYPGTGHYNQLEKEKRILTKDFENYNQFTLVYNHENLSPKKVRNLLEKAFRKYYFRPSYIFKFIKRKLRSI